MANPDFWQDREQAQKMSGQLDKLKEEVSFWDRARRECDELKTLNDLAVSEKDKSLNEEIEKALNKLIHEVDNLELRSWFTERFDERDAIVSIHPGAGGTESQDWAEMLLRMYLRWAQSEGFKAVLNEVSPGDEAGIKSATFTVEGKNAYGYMRAERGVHRLVRISPFDASKRRHTSFASVDVVPAVDEEIEVVIDPKDLRIETYRATGAGGQHVNVTDSAVRITHLPSRVVAQCQNERSQLQNKETAMKILRARLFELEEERKQEEIAKLRGEQKKIAWGSQIRSYVLHPYNLVKDHRTGLEKKSVQAVQAVLDGDLDPFIVVYHRWDAGKSRG